MRLHTYSIKSNVYAMEDEAAAEQNELCLMGCVRTDNLEEFIQSKE